MTPVLRVLTQREDSDCAIVALAMYLGHSYEDVLRAVTRIDRHAGKRGLWTTAMQRAGTKLGVTLRRRQAVDWDEDYGILLLPNHATVLRNGLVIDNGLVWDVEDFLRDRSVETFDCALLVTP
jgi:ABC-type bacteriocin/lantibiotic exporter with double-glycine peptidase domain